MLHSNDQKPYAVLVVGEPGVLALERKTLQPWRTLSRQLVDDPLLIRNPEDPVFGNIQLHNTSYQYSLSCVVKEFLKSRDPLITTEIFA